MICYHFSASYQKYNISVAIVLNKIPAGFIVEGSRFRNPVCCTLCALQFTEGLFLLPQFGSGKSLLWWQGCCFLFRAIYFSTRTFESRVTASSLVIRTIGNGGNEPESSACWRLLVLMDRMQLAGLLLWTDSLFGQLLIELLSQRHIQPNCNTA